MLIDYMRVSKADCSQVLDMQRDALLHAGIPADRLYENHAFGKRDDRPGLEACLKALRKTDTPGVSRRTLHLHITPTGELRADGLSLLARQSLNG